MKFQLLSSRVDVCIPCIQQQYHLFASTESLVTKYGPLPRTAASPASHEIVAMCVSSDFFVISKRLPIASSSLGVLRCTWSVSSSVNISASWEGRSLFSTSYSSNQHNHGLINAQLTYLPKRRDQRGHCVFVVLIMHRLFATSRFFVTTSHGVRTVEYRVRGIFKLRHQSGDTIPFSVWFVCTQVRYHVSSWLGRKSTMCPFFELFAWSATFPPCLIGTSLHYFLPPFDVVEHAHKYDSSLTLTGWCCSDEWVDCSMSWMMVAPGNTHQKKTNKLSGKIKLVLILLGAVRFVNFALPIVAGIGKRQHTVFANAQEQVREHVHVCSQKLSYWWLQ